MDGHGTHTCGIIAGRDIGIAPQAELLIAAVGGMQTTSLEHLVIALNWMMSFFALEPNLYKTVIVLLPFEAPDLADNRSEMVKRGLQQIIRTLVMDYEVLVIVGSGDRGLGHSNILADFPEVLAVGAVDSELAVTTFSSYRPAQEKLRSVPDVVGLGVDIRSSVPRSGNRKSNYESYSGTNVAAAYVAGIAALYGSMTGLFGLSLRQKLIDTALPLEDIDSQTGSGFVRFVS